MNIPRLLNSGILVLLLLTGCASNKEYIAQLDAMRRHPAWPMIRATAEMEVARRDGNTGWSHDAYYTSHQHTNGVWVVVASGAYPLNTLGDNIDMLIRDNGEVLSYSPRLSSHHK